MRGRRFSRSDLVRGRSIEEERTHPSESTIKSRRARESGLLAALVLLHFEPARGGIYLKDRIVFEGPSRRTYRFLTLRASLSFVDILLPRVGAKMLDFIARFLYFFFSIRCQFVEISEIWVWEGTRDEYKIPTTFARKAKGT